MSNRILSYRGLLANEGQDTILLTTKKGEVGYRVRKMEMLPTHASKDIEGVIKIYSVASSNVTTPTTDINFSDNELIAAGVVTGAHSHEIAWYSSVIFDQMIFNQDIYVTWKCIDKVEDINYYIELEVIKLGQSEAMVATLKDIRNSQ